MLGVPRTSFFLGGGVSWYNISYLGEVFCFFVFCLKSNTDCYKIWVSR